MIALFAAMQMEAAACLRCLPDAHRNRQDGFPEWQSAGGVTLCQTGLGSRAGEAARLLLDRQRFRAALSVGVAGGLDSRLQPGELVLCERVIGPGPEDVRCDLALIELAEKAAKQAGLAWRRGSAVTVQAAVSAGEKARLRSETGADVAEMESFWIGAAAAGKSVSFLAVRVVLDEATQQLPEIEMLRPDGTVRRLQAIGALVRRPSIAGTLVRLAGRRGLALANLSLFLSAFLGDPVLALKSRPASRVG